MTAIFSTSNIDLIEEATEERGSIYLGNWTGARNVEYLQTTKIKYVVSILPAFIACHNDFEANNIIQKIFEANDVHTYDIYSKLHEVADYINESSGKGNVLVHCAAGVSRSATCLIAYYIKYRGMSYEEALSLLRNKRPIVYPNSGFQEQLKRFENELKI